MKSFKDMDLDKQEKKRKLIKHKADIMKNKVEICEFEQQALDFLKDTNSTLVITKNKGKGLPPWADARPQNYVHTYDFELSTAKGMHKDMMYTSKNNTKNNKYTSKYDILCLLEADYSISNYKEFLELYGYEDNLKNARLYKLFKKQNDALKYLYTEDELQALAEIS